jgi:hypothetical protein
MATQTIILASFDEGRVQYTAEFDDVSLLLTALRCVNNSDQGPTPAPSSGRVSLINDPSKAFPAGSGTDSKKARITQPWRPDREQPGRRVHLARGVGL